MKEQDVINQFTAAVKEFIDSGYVFFAEPMSGSQGEVIKAVLRRGDEAVALSVFRSDLPSDIAYVDFRNSLVMYTEIFSVSAWKADEGVFWLAREREWKSTVACKFFNIARGAEEPFFTCSFDEACAAMHARHARRQARRGNHVCKREHSGALAKKIAAQILHRFKGYKRARPEDVDSIVECDYGFSRSYVIFLTHKLSANTLLDVHLDKNLEFIKM